QCRGSARRAATGDEGPQVLSTPTGTTRRAVSSQPLRMTYTFVRVDPSSALKKVHVILRRNDEGSAPPGLETGSGTASQDRADPPPTTEQWPLTTRDR